MDTIITRGDLVDQDFESIRNNVANRYEFLSSHAQIHKETLDVLAEYLNIVLTDSDEPLSIQERLIIAAQMVHSERKSGLSRDRAIKTGSAFVRIALSETRRTFVNPETLI